MAFNDNCTPILEVDEVVSQSYVFVRFEEMQGSLRIALVEIRYTREPKQTDQNMVEKFLTFPFFLIRSKYSWITPLLPTMANLLFHYFHAVRDYHYTIHNL